MVLLSHDLLCTKGFPSTVRTTGLLCHYFLHFTGIPYHELLVLLSLITPLLSKHSFGMGTNVFLGLSHPKYISGVSYGIPWISALNLQKAVPWNDLVKWLANILHIGQYLNLRSPINILSLISKYLTRMCSVWLPLDILPLILRIMIAKLSCYTTTSLTSNPFTSTKYLDHRNSVSPLSDLISSTSVEIIEFRFFLLDMLANNNHNRDTVAPMWLRQPGCIAYDAPTHHFTLFSLSTININGM